jgi:hypothetical protein
MTEAEARQVKDARNLPWNTPCFVFVEGRYYLGMWFIKVPQGRDWPHGGNITAQCWRYETNPTEWYVICRFRCYADDSGKAWESDDRKSWSCGKLSGDEALIEKKMAEFTNAASGITGLVFLATPPQIYPLIFKGDFEKAMAMVAKEKPFWMHTKISP